MHLCDQDVLVVARVTDQGHVQRHAAGPQGRLPVVDAGQVAEVVVPVDGEEAVPVGPLVVQVGLITGAAAVHRIQVESRGAEVVQRVGIVAAGEAGRRIEGDVVVEELPQVGVASWDLGVVEFVVDGRVVVLLGWRLRCAAGPTPAAAR